VSIAAIFRNYGRRFGSGGHPAIFIRFSHMAVGCNLEDDVTEVPPHHLRSFRHLNRHSREAHLVSVLGLILSGWDGS
jgi:hypothetical protein